MKQLIFPLIAMACLSINGCATYKDERSPEAQRTELNATVKELVGQYTVVDSRNSYDGDYTEVEIRAVDGAMNAVLTGPKTQLFLTGTECSGRLQSNPIYDFRAAANCSAKAANVSLFSMEAVTKEQVRKSGAIIAAFPPLTVPAGSFLFDFYSAGSGRPHYYILKRI